MDAIFNLRKIRSHCEVPKVGRNWLNGQAISWLRETTRNWMLLDAQVKESIVRKCHSRSFSRERSWDMYL